MSKSNPLKLKTLMLWYSFALVTVVLDQVTKVWADTALAAKNLILLPFFKFELAYNPGAAFSFLGQADGWQRWLFSVIAIVVSFVIAAWLAMIVKRGVAGRSWELSGLSLILGGAIGNLIDRLIYGYVIDFISVHYQSYHFPTFNIADSAICVGAALLIFDAFFIQGNREKFSKNPEEKDRVDSNV